MNFKSRKIGIWGTGIVGTSALHFFSAQDDAEVILYDARPISADMTQLCASYQVHIYPPEQLDLFLQECEYILPSAGINLAPYARYKDKFLNELDIFFSRYKNPIIAITGTLGKTTITQAIHTMLTHYGIRAQIGGNIGVGLFDLLDDQGNYDYAVLELSSFQLEHARLLKPAIAIWTNLYPNHLDRHSTLHEYFLAKLPLLSNQQAGDYAIIHESVKPHLTTHAHESVHSYFSHAIPERLKEFIGEYKTFPEHYRILYELAQILNLDIHQLPQVFDKLTIPEHRVAYVGTSNGVDFYDDSKSTVVEATLGALQRFPGKPIILFFGGVSKGVSRAHFFDNLPSTIKHICFFGKETQLLKKYCPTSVNSSEHQTLEDAFNHCVTLTQPGDIVLFSPGGASFDLFNDYKHRGKAFQKLVKELT